MKMSVAMILASGALIAGVMYFAKNPNKFKMIKDMELDAMNKMNQIIE